LEFSRTATQGFVKPEAKVEEIPFANAEVPYAIVTQNFVNAILDSEPLIASGPEGIHAVELPNAMVFSSLLGQTLELPMDGSAREKQLNGFITSSQVKKNVAQVATDDFASSFRK
ncbi:MAG: gfo/Idh/MocA family oxidoreductase, partial [Verrucomicrobiota bacterium]